MMHCLQLAAVLFLASTSPGAEELPDPADIVRVKGLVSYDAVHPGMEFEMAAVCSVLEGWHVNSHEPSDEAFVATEVLLALPEQVELVDVKYPAGAQRKLSFSEKPLSVYDGAFAVLSSARLSAETEPKEYAVSCTLRYQACDDRMCLEPVDKEFSMVLKVVGPDTPISKSELDLFTSDAVPPGGSGGFGSRGVAFTFLLVFVGGLALNLTPCIYPMIPITVSYFGGQSRGSQRTLIALGAAYALGIAVTYSVVGLVAALTGSLLGAAMQSPVVLAFVALVLVALALSMFDVYALRLPAGLARVSGSSRQGVLGSLFMGLTLGFVIAPCVGPFVLGLLTYVGGLGNPLLGFWLFFTLAVGMGLPLVVLGVLSGSISRLPRSGDWMIWVKRVFGFVLLAMAVYFLRTVIPGIVYWVALALIALSAGLYLGWIEKVETMGKVFFLLRRALGSLSILLVLWLVGAPGHTFMGRGHGQLIEWQQYTEPSLSSALRSGKPVMIDFSAKWCVPCGEMDERTFGDARVVAKARSFSALRVDLTSGADNDTRSLMNRYGVAGVPTLLFLGKGGGELRDFRFVGFIGPDSLMVLMEKVLSRTEGKAGGD